MKETLKKIILSNYKSTFINSLVPVINNKFTNDSIKKIILIPDDFPTTIKEIKLLDSNNNEVQNDQLKKKILKFWKLKKVAFEKNSDYYFPHKNKSQIESIYHRSLGEDFNY